MSAFWLQWWGQRSARERFAWLMGACAVGVILLYAFLVQPALSGVRHISAELPTLRATLAQMQQQSSIAAGLSSRAGSPALTGERLKESLRTAVTAHGWTPVQVASVGNGVRLQVNGISFADWVGFLNDARRQYRVQVVELHATALPNDLVNVSVVLGPPASAS